MSVKNQTGQGLEETLKLFQEEGGFADLANAVLRHHNRVRRGTTLGCQVAVAYAAEQARIVLERAKQGELLEALAYVKPARFPGMPVEQNPSAAEMERVHDTLTCIVKEAARKACKGALQGETGDEPKKASEKDAVPDFQDSGTDESRIQRRWRGPVKGNLPRQDRFAHHHAVAR